MSWPILCVFGLTLATMVICKNKTCKLLKYADLIIRSELILSTYSSSRINNSECFGIYCRPSSTAHK